MADLDALFNTPGLKRVDEVSLEEFKRHKWLNEDISILRWLFIIADQVRAVREAPRVWGGATLAVLRRLRVCGEQCVYVKAVKL